MKKFLFLAAALCVCAASSAQKVVGFGKSTGHVAYDAGERLVYSMRYAFMKGGEAHFSVVNANLDGRQVKHVTCHGRTTGFADVIFKVRDTYESYIDPATQMPIKAIRNIREGRYTYYDEILYNRDSSQVNTLRKGIRPIPENALDIVSAFYHARNNSFNNALVAGDTILYVTYFDDEVWHLRIKYQGKEFVKTDFGNIECYRFCPITEVGRAFETEDDMQVWISTDSNRIPIKIKFDMKVGSFVCELSQFSGLKHPWGR